MGEWAASKKLLNAACAKRSRLYSDEITALSLVAAILAVIVIGLAFR
jgi:hypothetical protein